MDAEGAWGDDARDMSRVMRSPAPVTCPTCAWVSVRAPHYCPGCGFDYWRQAAGLGAAEPIVVRETRRADGGFSAALMVAGLVGLVLTGVVTAVVVLGGLEPEGQQAPQIANTLPSRGPEEFLIQRFFREARSPYAAFAMTSDSTLRQTVPAGAAVVVTESLVLHGDNWIGDSSAVSDEETIAISAAAVDGAYFERVAPDAPWVKVDVYGQVGTASPFQRIATVGEIEYVGLETTGGVTLHHLVVTKWLGGSGLDFRMLGYDRVGERENQFDIWVNDDGVPIRARQHATVVVVEAGESYLLTIEGEITFRDWGIVEPIEAPT